MREAGRIEEAGTEAGGIEETAVIRKRAMAAAHTEFGRDDVGFASALLELGRHVDVAGGAFGGDAGVALANARARGVRAGVWLSETSTHAAGGGEGCCRMRQKKSSCDEQ